MNTNKDLQIFATKITNAKNKEELDKLLIELKGLEKNFVNTSSKIIACQSCQLLDDICRRAWELSNKECHTFQYRCEDCEINWTSTFSK